MEKRGNYCPLSMKCPHEPIRIEPNSYFLIEPFDDAKSKREEAIETALRAYYKQFGGEPKLNISNLGDSHLRGLYCDICYKIKSSKFCIVDITGEIHNIVNKEGKIEEKIILRSNVAFELGLAYGLNKPTFVLSKAINGKREFLSDIKFIKYIDVQEDNLATIFYEVLCQSHPLINIGYLAGNNIEDELLIKTIKQIIHFKKMWPIIKEKNYLISEVVWDENKIVGIITDSEGLIENICFEIYILKGNFEKKIGLLKVDHINKKFAQVSFCYSEDCENTYMNKIYTTCFKNGAYTLGEHRLVPIISESLEEYIDRFEIDQFEDMD